LIAAMSLSTTLVVTCRVPAIMVIAAPLGASDPAALRRALGR
jgi:hypothetical protein